MQWKPHNCILNVLNTGLSPDRNIIKFNIMYKVSSQRSSLFTITLPTEGSTCTGIEGEPEEEKMKHQAQGKKKRQDTVQVH